MRTDPEQRVTFTVLCIDVPECQVAFEPEGAIHTLRQGDEFEVEISGPVSPDRLEIAYLPNRLIINAWAGAQTRVRNRVGDELPT